MTLVYQHELPNVPGKLPAATLRREQMRGANARVRVLVRTDVAAERLPEFGSSATEPKKSLAMNWILGNLSNGEGTMTGHAYDKEITALLVIDPSAQAPTS